MKSNIWSHIDSHEPDCVCSCARDLAAVMLARTISAKVLDFVRSSVAVSDVKGAPNCSVANVSTVDVVKLFNEKAFYSIKTWHVFLTHEAKKSVKTLQASRRERHNNVQ